MSAIIRVLGIKLFDFERNRLNRPFFKWYYNPMTWLLWLLSLPLFLLQFFGFFILLGYIGTHKRRLMPEEIEELKTVFSDSVNYEKVRVKERSKWSKFGAKYIKAEHLGFVFLNTIHFSRQINTKINIKEMAWLVHETTHVSQYQKLGIVYIVKALRAQRNGGYNYPNEWLNSALKDFNFEQQADIAKDYYLCVKQQKDTACFQYLIESIQAQEYA